MAFIEIDYADTIRKADRLEELAVKLNNIAAAKMAELQSGMNRNWKGSASAIYQKKTNTLIQQITSQAKSLKSAAKSIRKSAEDYRRLEQLANTLFGG